MKIRLYEIKKLKVVDTEGKEIEKFAFDHLKFNLFDPRNVCKDHYARIHFQWQSRTFYRPKEEEMKNSYNASKSCKLFSFAGT